jgi:ribulose 1,5-bisphosphate carboxylase large subunit-like protein
VRATFELDPPEWGATLAQLESTGVAAGPEAARGRVVAAEGPRVTIELPALEGETSVAALVSAVLAGEWGDRADVRRCRLVGVAWPDGLPGPAYDAPDRVLVGAIVKPSLGLTPREAADVAGALARGGADLVKDDELLCDPAACPLEERVPAIAAALPDGVLYAANVTGPTETLLARAGRTVELGATALMLNVFAQGIDSLRALREADFGVPLFAHRVGAAFLVRGERVGVSARVVAELTRLCGADYVQVGSFSDRVHDSDGDVRAEIDACAGELRGLNRSVAVVGGGVGPANAQDQLDRAGARAGVMLLLGSAAYEHPGGVEEGVRAAAAVARAAA